MDSAGLARLERFIALLAEENQRQNLVSAASLADVWRRHIADSAQLLALVPRETSTPWLDLGTGAGLPGIIIAALRPDAEVVMVESRSRRIAWLNHLCAELGLERASTIGQRLELVQTRHVGVISARAFAPLDRLLTLSARFSTAATTWLLPKGRSAAQELQGLNGWHHALTVRPSLTDAEAGIISGHVFGKSGVKR
ncbi:MAG TPA: 16S rRNA (guanine(527)-N(7))-methyltransferase RsmG [Novosphingobium sp.]|nr:16S rRNA (guanine(527)-N(7))-methyltransferase RsmG [Novosphingobium sp.]